MKTYVLIFALMLTFCSSLLADCYSAWLEAYETATEEKDRDIEDCSGRRFSSMCLAEAHAYYGKKIDEAGTAYYHCVL